MAQLAIRGHATRGREVIELLEMLGGINRDKYSGDLYDKYYFINDNYVDWSLEAYLESDSICFTLEEFLEKFPYKVGDKVVNNDWDDDDIYIISAMYWKDNSVVYSIRDLDGCLHAKEWHTNDLQPYKEETMEGKLISKEEVSLKINTSQMEKRQIIFSADAPNETELVLGDNFEIKVEDGKTYVVRKKPQYPKTYEECCEIMGIDVSRTIEHDDCPFYKDETFYEHTLLSSLVHLRKLLICRDAYWKIAGDWKPDWRNNQFKYIIVCAGGNIINDTYTTKNCILAFPTSEMRDAFKENFDKDLEFCKELL